eukprot:CAMPEP_0184686934 /NCGR_PEP_ID=MMETSP0312-20130426/24653_1 /TAXON_ID=31354 /ORGANISM="Compsopogon coeruleus, Strain SAG 36.94" /LENGTH=69 /DNA_ID=CAMNT_0027142561 /DNA_START=972 /DNA_END=1181 /DNA_ORIENTATION=+
MAQPVVDEERTLVTVGSGLERVGSPPEMASTVTQSGGRDGRAGGDQAMSDPERPTDGSPNTTSRRTTSL